MRIVHALPMRRRVVNGCQALVASLALLTSVVAVPMATAAQETCVDCVRYAGTELNLRQEPSLEGEVLRFVPQGAEVELTGGAEVNGYVPVTYDSVPGYVIALGLVATEAEVAEFVPPEATSTAPPAEVPAESVGSVASPDLRLTLSPLLLRSGPSADAEPILTLPEGAEIVLTHEGAENGYVTVDYGGAIGWVYADLIARPDEV